MIRTHLRGGTGSTLFVISGAGGDVEEVRPLAEALDGDMEVVALAPVANRSTTVPWTIDVMAEDATALVRQHRPNGPYRLLGYSLGGVIALECAVRLRSAGEEVEFLGIVDPIFDQRHWPTGLFVRATLRRAIHHTKELAALPPRQAVHDVVVRARRLANRVGGRVRPADLSTGRDPAPGHSGEESVQDINMAALAAWTPRVFPEQVVLYAARDGDFGCDLAELWRPWLPAMSVRRIPGPHVEIVRNPNAVKALAQEVDQSLTSETGPRLRALVVATFRWSSAARLAVELRAAGWDVDAVAPRGSALHSIAAVDRSAVLSILRPLGSLRRELTASRADIVVPFDDRTRQALHRLYAAADSASPAGARLKALIEHSLGSPESFPKLYSRATVTQIAAQSGVLCPVTARVRDQDDIHRWLADHRGPGVLKTDGSWGGREVSIIASDDQVARAWSELSRPPGLARCVKRLLVERDPWPLRTWLSGTRPGLSIQSYIEGRPGNIAITCLSGDVLGAVPAEVIRSNGVTGPSTVLKIVDHPDMIEAAKLLVSRLQISGFCGLDFVIENDTGRAFFVELNPRATPTSHLLTSEGDDPLFALRAALGDSRRRIRAGSYPNGLVALFPQEVRRDPTSVWLTQAYHDVPLHAPDLVSHALSENAVARWTGMPGAAWRQRLAVLQLIDRVGGATDRRSGG